MYSKAIINAVKEDFARRCGWMPEEHSIDEVDEFNEYIEDIVDIEKTKTTRNYFWNLKSKRLNGKAPTAKRIEWLKRWRQNEKFLCFSDAEYFVTRYARIRNVKEAIIRLEYRKAQILFHKLLAKYDDRQVAIQLFVLKARQVGISTIVAMYFLHRILFRTNVHAIMASAQVPQSDKLAKMVWTTWEKLPFWLPPPQTVMKEREPQWANGGALSIQAGSQDVGIAQGSTPTCIHLSEIGEYKTPKKTIEEGVFPAAHQTDALFFVLEGTGSTASAWQKEKWEYYKTHWGHGGRFRTLFIPPCCADDIYPHADWLRGNPMPEGWPRQAIEETKRMKNRGELFVRSTDYLAEELGTRWSMGREYMWYWQCGYQEAVASHSEKTYLSQNAITDDDAFQSKFDPVFNDETIEITTKGRQKNYAAYFITGKTIIVGSEMKPFEPPAEQIDYDGERIQLKWEANDGNKYEWELVPCLPFDDEDDVQCFDKLLIFEEPRKDADYSEAIDTADGLNLPNEDRTSVTLLRHPTSGKDRDINVASFTTLRMNPAQISRAAAAIAVLFGTDGEGNVTSANPMVMQFIIEQIRKTGDECQNSLIIMGFYDHHIMHFYDDKNSLDPSKGTKLGWRTSKWSRPLLLGRWVDAVNLGWVKVNDPITIRQMKTFVRREKSGQSEMGHETGQHDDNIFSQAMCWTRGHDMDNTAARMGSWFETHKPKEEEEVDTGWAEQLVSIGGYDDEE
jgi:hypothetical protein